MDPGVRLPHALPRPSLPSLIVFSAKRNYAAASKNIMDEPAAGSRDESMKKLISMYETMKKESASDDGASKNGRIAQIMGAVVDVEFPRGAEPKLLNAIKCKHPLKENSSLDNTLTLEVAAHLPDGIVRCGIIYTLSWAFHALVEFFCPLPLPSRPRPH